MRHYLCFLIIIVAILSGCTNKKTSTIESKSIIFTDDYGRTINVPSNPTRIVSVSPAITEMIFSLGAQNFLVGRTDFCTYPTDAQQIESIGGISNLNIEKILSLKPDLVLSGSMVSKKNVQHLNEMGIPIVCITEKQQFEGLYENIEKIGLLVGRKQTADSLITALKSATKQVSNSNSATKQQLNNISRPTVYYVVGFGKAGNFTAGGNTFINDIIYMAGGCNIAENIQGWSISLEALMKADPDYIIIRREDAESFCQMRPYCDLTAVQKGRVIALESGVIDLQVPRNIDGIIQIASILSTYKSSNR